MIAVNILKFIKDDLLSVLVKPNSSKTEIIGFDDNKKLLRIAVSAVPDKGKANQELIKFLRKSTKRKCEIVSGKKSREKNILFE